MTILNSFIMCMAFVLVSGHDLKTDAAESVGNNPASVTESTMSGHKMTGIIFSAAGGICAVSSVPFFIKAATTDSRFGIDIAVANTIGFTLLGCGLVFEGVSIPFYRKHKELMKANKTSVMITPNAINVAYTF